MFGLPMYLGISITLPRYIGRVFVLPKYKGILVDITEVILEEIWKVLIFSISQTPRILRPFENYKPFYIMF